MIQIIGTIVCLVFAVIWVVAWFDPSPALRRMFDSAILPALSRKDLPAMLGALLFAAAPLLRRDTRPMRYFLAAGIVATISPGLEAAARGGVPLNATLWLVVPLAIAAWVLLGPASPESEVPPRLDPRHPMNLRPIFVLAVGVIAVILAVSVPPGQFIINLGFGDIVVPRYGAITFGLCCIVGALAAWASSLDWRSRKAVHARAKPAILVSALPQGGFQWSVVIGGQTVGTGERATEWEARGAADALVQRIEPAPEAR